MSYGGAWTDQMYIFQRKMSCKGLARQPSIDHLALVFHEIVQFNKLYLHFHFMQRCKHLQYQTVLDKILNIFYRENYYRCAHRCKYLDLYGCDAYFLHVTVLCVKEIVLTNYHNFLIIHIQIQRTNLRFFHPLLLFWQANVCIHNRT